MGALKAAGSVGAKAGRVIVYRVTDVAKMFAHWQRPIPQIIEDICNGIVRDIFRKLKCIHYIITCTCNLHVCIFLYTVYVHIHTIESGC